MATIKDLSGKKFGMVTAKNRIVVLSGGNRRSKWICQCECGNTRDFFAQDLLSGSVDSCGCMTKTKRLSSMLRHYSDKIECVNKERMTCDSVKLQCGSTCYFDTQDFELVSKYIWTSIKSTNTRYASSASGGFRVFMHNLIMGKKEGYFIDHIDGNGLNNKRSNLRWATPSQNQWNKRRQRTNRSKYKGVTPRGEKWVAAIQKHGKRYHLGTFDTEYLAAIAYDKKALELFGEFAKVNIGGES